MEVSLRSPEADELQYTRTIWEQSITCQGTRAGGIYNGSYSIYDWYRDAMKEGSTHMKTYTAVVERCPDTGLYVGYVPGFPGAHSQAETLDELNRNLQEVIQMLQEGQHQPH